MSRPLAPKGGNDRVYTPDSLAKSIIQHFNPSGSILDPCKGHGAFFNNFPQTEIDWCELDQGRDFFDYVTGKHYDWIITNPPWSLMRPFLSKSMEVSDNVVFLCLTNALFMKARQRDIQKHNFGLKEILFLDTPPKPWPQTGFSLSANYLKKNYVGDVKISNLK